MKIDKNCYKEVAKRPRAHQDKQPPMQLTSSIARSEEKL